VSGKDIQAVSAEEERGKWLNEALKSVGIHTHDNDSITG
jgi:hypothetical protein